MTFNQFLIRYAREQFGFIPERFTEETVRDARKAYESQQTEETSING